MSENRPAILMLEDGTTFSGKSFGAIGKTLGEVCFNTGITGYQEILTDPSYAKQIVTMTAPHIGNYGVNSEDIESSKIQASGFVIKEESIVPSNWRAEISIGDYILTNGAIAAVVFIDSITRLIPGVLGDGRSNIEESFSVYDGILEAPAYTRPAEYNDMKVPEVLLSGNHQKITDWKFEKAQQRTKDNRPDLMS